MPIPQSYYLNGVDLQSSTAVFLDAALSICAPDGYYSDGTIVRKQQSCVLLSEQSCPNCCQEPCSLWNFSSILGAFTVSYTECTTGSVVEVTYPDPTNEDVCVVKGTTPTLVSGDADITLVSDCGCCTSGDCNTWRVLAPLTGAAAFSYIDCDNLPYTITLRDGDFIDVCVKFQTVPQLVAGEGSVEFIGCGC